MTPTPERVERLRSKLEAAIKMSRDWRIKDWPKQSSAVMLTKREAVAIQEALAALTAAGQGWRPIETAPKDGTRVMLAGAEGGIGIGCFDAGEWEDDAHTTLDDEPLVAWQPLPAPPSTEEVT